MLLRQVVVGRQCKLPRGSGTHEWCGAGVISATNRLQKLLTAKDKKQCILDMAAANEIDLALIQLLQQNIDGARAAGREDVAGAATSHCGTRPNIIL